ncbi:MAG: glycosyltransferase family 4 protein [Candidatus Harrisonbacteria bacterium]|nr:glycosyltransferase family 4 protein [Candidatus Harrisonbacteria bacterium]
MKILILNPEYPPLGGGAGVFCKNLAEELVKLGNEVTIITRGIEKDLRKIETTPLLYLLPGVKKDANIFLQLFFFAKGLRRYLPQILQEKSFDVAISFFTYPTAIVAGNIFQKQKIKHVIAVRGSDAPFYRNSFFLFDIFLGRFLSRLAYSKASKVVANSYDLLSLITPYAPAEKRTVIENGVQTDFFYPEEKKELKEEKVILTTARLTPHKDLGSIILAFSFFLKEGGRAQLRITGEGKEEERLKKLAAKLGIERQVNFLGKVAHERMPDIFRKADLFILVSKREGMSNALLEAGASGLPLIITKTGDSERLFPHARFVPFRNPQAIADQIQKFFSDDSLWKEGAKKSREAARKQDIKIVSRKWLTTLSETIM